MRHLTCLLLAITLAAPLSACVAETDEGGEVVSLFSPDDSGKEDSISGKQIFRDITFTRGWSNGSTEGEFVHSFKAHNQVYDDGEVVNVSGFLYYVGLSAVNRFEVSAKILTHYTTKLGVQILKEDAAGRWQTVECGPQRHNYFTAFEIDRAQRVVKVNGSRFYSLRDCGLDADGSTDRLGVFVIPISTWGSLDGFYHYLLTATCNGGPCSSGDY